MDEKAYNEFMKKFEERLNSMSDQELAKLMDILGFTDNNEGNLSDLFDNSDSKTR